MREANIFWISIDSLRKDFLHIYNPEQNRRTYLDDLAEQGCIFENAFPGGNWTMPSHATMLTGLDTTSHTIWSWSHRFPQGTETAFDLFHRAGYEVGCFAISQLRDLFSGTLADHFGDSDDAGVIRCIESSKPFFVFWHTYNVHYPYGMVLPNDYDDSQTDYDHPSRTLNYLRSLIIGGRTELITDSYRREIQRVARFVGRVAAKLKKLGKFERTYFIITADHGEAWEPYTTFHCNFREEVLRVPLFISGPGVPQTRVGAPVSQVDLLPTVLQLCEIDVGDRAEAFDGGSLVRAMNEELNGGHPIVIAGPDGVRVRHRYIAIRNGEWILVTALNHWAESFHRIAPDGLSANLLDRPLAREGSSALEEFRAMAERHAERFLSNRDNVVELSKGTQKKLQALGYV
jgi:arylsulfatase A-like enzyme